MAKAKIDKKISWDNLDEYRHLFEEEETTEEERKRWEKAKAECRQGKTVSLTEVFLG